MTSTPAKPPKKEKAKRQSAEKHAEGLRYIHMMYGPTAGEQKLVARKINLGTTYLASTKFQAFMAAFIKGEIHQFSVTDKGKNFVVSTDGSQILFDGKTVYYSRPLNRYEDNLLMNRVTMTQFQTTEAFIHLAVAVLRSLPELGPVQITYVNHKFYLGSETLEVAAAEQGPNLLIGAYRHKKVHEGVRK